MALGNAIGRAVAAQRGQLLCWVPVFLGIGIGAYFALQAEPGPGLWGLIVPAGPGLLLVLRRLPENARPPAAALALVLAGLALAGLRAWLVAEPVLAYRYHGPVVGRVVGLDRSAADAPRLTLDHVVLAGMEPGRVPARVRISLHAKAGLHQPVPGLIVGTTAHLAPPTGPAEPGGFDFRRQAWFGGLGAVGYTRVPVLALAPPEAGGPGLHLYRARMALSGWVQSRLPGVTGAFAAAVMTGDRSAIGRPVLEDLRAANLAHLLAISGLHMGLVTGLVFSALRAALALIPPLALRWPARKIAAVGALAAGGGYLALAGGNVATQRAFIMVSVMFLAVLLGRRALTLRAVAVAATVLLALRPESLVQPGFQMSFSATVALVAVFRALNARGPLPGPRWLKPVLAVVISSAVAGAATAPFAAAHFNRIAVYGLLANLLSVPLMGLAVMPGALLAVLLAPIGLGGLGLALMRPPIDWILGVAHWVATMPGAVRHVPAPPAAALPLLALGLLFLVLWQGGGRVRLAGLIPVALAFWLWGVQERPAVLVSQSGGLIGALGPQGRALNKPRGDGFTARIWLENDGDGATQAQAGQRPGPRRQAGQFRLSLAGQRIVQLGGRGAGQRAAAACARGAALVISTVAPPEPVPGCRLYDPARLRRSGALAIFVRPGAGLEVREALEQAGRRPWSGGSGPRRAGR